MSPGAQGWMYQLGAVVSALTRAGLRIEYLHENPFTVYRQFPFLERREDTHWYLPEGMLRVPLLFSLRASKAPGRSDDQRGTENAR